MHSTTVIGVLRDNQVAVASDGQVSMGDGGTIIKHTARKVRRLSDGHILAGFAGSVADAHALQDSFEKHLNSHGGKLLRAAIEFAKEWRTDKILRQLNAMMIVAEESRILVLSGDGNVIEPDDGLAGVGSGGPYALAAARALLTHTEMSAADIAVESLKVAAGICVYTNENIVIETIG